jgi:hypothetical protein
VTFRRKNATSRRSYGWCIAKVLEVVDQSPQPIRAIEINRSTGIKVTTCRKCLSRLAKKGKIKKHSYGYYASLSDNVALNRSMVAAADSPLVLNNAELRLHCLRLRVFDVSGNPRKWFLDLDVVKISLQRYASRTAQVFVDCMKDYSLDYVAFRLLVEIALHEVGQTDWDNVLVTSHEFNHDYLGLRLDGVTATTLKAIDGSFRRVYNKRYGLRDEVKTVGSIGVEDVLRLLEGGTNYSIMQRLSVISEEIREERSAVSEAAQQMRRLVDELLGKQTDGGS